jgi:hypothetical protein
MTYEDWCKNSKQILAQAKEWNEWVDEKKHYLLTNVGPRIAQLGKTGYYGCGFHYEMEGQFGKLIISMMYPWQPSANHCEKIKDQMVSNVITKVIYEGLMEQIEKAEKSVSK